AGPPHLRPRPAPDAAPATPPGTAAVRQAPRPARSARGWAHAASAGGWSGTGRGSLASASEGRARRDSGTAADRSAPRTLSGDNARPRIATIQPMLDPNLLRNDLPALAERLRRSRGFDLDVAALESLEAERKRLQMRTQELQNLRNTRSREIGKVKAQDRKS